MTKRTSEDMLAFEICDAIRMAFLECGRPLYHTPSIDIGRWLVARGWRNDQVSAISRIPGEPRA